MKVKAEVFLILKKNIAFSKILVTGSDEPLISYVKNYIMENFKKRGFFVDVSNNYNDRSMGNLFSENKTLFVLSDFPTNKEITHEELDNKRRHRLHYNFNANDGTYSIEMADGDLGGLRLHPERNYYYALGLKRLADNPNLIENPGY